MRTKLTILIIMLAGMIWLGVSLGRWASAQSRACEESYQQAVNVLRGE